MNKKICFLLAFGIILFSCINVSSAIGVGIGDGSDSSLGINFIAKDVLNDLADVFISNPMNAQVIIYNESSEAWYNSYLNDSAHHVNASDYWITNEGALNNPSDIEHNWLSNLFWSVAGHVMDTFLDMNNNSIQNILSTQYNISGCSDVTAGTFCYDSNYDTMRFVTDSGQVLQMNQETTMPSKNIEGSTVLDGSVVYIMGATGANPNFKFAKADNLSTSGLVGVVTKDCINNQVCPVVFFGLIHGFDTSSYVAGDHLYISDIEDGNFTTTPPEFPNVPIWVATVIRVHAEEGTIFVFPRLDSANGITMNTLGLVGDLIQTDYKIRSVAGNAAIGQNVFTIEMNGTSGIDIPHLVLQPGGAGQASTWVRSGIVVPESVLCLNTTNRTEPNCFADEAGFIWEILDFNTNVTEGADWGITGELEVIRDANIQGNTTINLIYGELWLHDEITVDVTTVNVYVNITDLNSTWNNGFSYDGSGTLTAQFRGVYETQWHMSYSGGANSEYDAGVGINGVITEEINGNNMEKTHGHRTIGTGGQIGSMSGGGNLCIDVNDEITMMMSDEKNPVSDPTIITMQLNLKRVGDC